jgi:hypothetical protein
MSWFGWGEAEKSYGSSDSDKEYDNRYRRNNAGRDDYSSFSSRSADRGKTGWNNKNNRGGGAWSSSGGSQSGSADRRGTGDEEMRDAPGKGPAAAAAAVAAGGAGGAAVAAASLPDAKKRKEKTYKMALFRWFMCCGHRCYLFNWADCAAWYFTGGCLGCCSCWELCKLRELTLAANKQGAVADAKRSGDGTEVSEKSCLIASCLCVCQLHRLYLFGCVDWQAYCFTCGPCRRMCSCCELCNMRELSMAGASVTKKEAPGAGSM